MLFSGCVPSVRKEQSGGRILAKKTISNYVHMNWGWDGDSNGWFNMDWVNSCTLDSQNNASLPTVNAAEYSRGFPFVHYDIKPR